MGLLLYIICFLSLTAFNILSLFSVVVVLMIMCVVGMFYFGQVCLVFWRLPVLEWAKLSQDCGNFLFYRIYFHLFSFFNAHDSQVWSFGGVGEFLHTLFTALEWFDQDFFCFFL
jgi:hypothetical protein